MSRPVNNVATSDDYSDAATFTVLPPASGMTLTVNNAAIYYQQAEAMSGYDRGQNWQPESFLIPGRYNFDDGDKLPGSFGFVGLRIRSAVPGTPARISISGR